MTTNSICSTAYFSNVIHLNKYPKGYKVCKICFSTYTMIIALISSCLLGKQLAVMEQKSIVTNLTKSPVINGSS